MKIYMRLFKHRDYWYIEINGKRRSLRTKDKNEAKRLYNQIRREWLAGKLAHLTGECRKTLGEYITEFLAWAEKVQAHSTFRANRLALKKLTHYAGPATRLDRVSRKHLDQMVADCKAKGLSVASINNYIRHARAALNKAVEWGYIRSNPLAGVKELPREKRPPEFIPREVITKFLAGIEDIDRRRLITAYLATGRRRAELLALDWQDIDLKSGKYLIRRSKAHLSRWYPINNMFRTVLLSIGEKKEGRVFDRWKHPDTLSKIVKDELRKAGLGHLHLHHLRHTFASLKVMEGTPLRTLQELLGHTEYRTTEIYAHIGDDYLKKASEINLGPVDLNE